MKSVVGFLSLIQVLFFFNNAFSQVNFAMKLQKGHNSATSDADLSKDGNYFISSGLDDQTILWDVKTGRQITELPGSDVVSIFPDSKRFIMRGTESGYMDIREIPSGKVIESINLNGSISLSAMKISPDAKYLITSDLKLYDLELKEEIRQFTTTDVTWDLAFSPDGKYLLVGTRGDVAKLFEVETGNLIRTFNTDPGGTYAVGFSNDNKYVLTANYSVAKQWDLVTGALVRTFTVKGEVSTINCSGDNKLILIGSSSAIATLFNLSTGAQIRTFGKVKEISGGFADFFPDGNRIIVDNGAEDYMTAAFKIWKVSDNKSELKNLAGNISNLYTTYPDKRNPLRILSVDENQKSQCINMWDLSKGKIVKTFKFNPEYESITQIDFRNDTIIALISKTENIYFTYDVARAKKITEFNYSSFYTYFYHLNEKTIMVVKNEKQYPNGFLGLDKINIATGKIEFSHPAAKFPGAPYNFSRDGKYAVFYQDKQPYLYDLSTATMISPIDEPENTLTSFEGEYLRQTGTYDKRNAEYKLFSLPDLNLVFTGSYEMVNSLFIANMSKSGKYAFTSSNAGLTVNIWEVSTNSLLHEIQVAEPASFVQFSPDEKLVLISGKQLYNLEQSEFIGLEGDYYYHGFSPDGKFLTSSGHENNDDLKAIKIFHQLDGTPVFTIAGIHGKNSDYVIFTPDGYFSTTRKANENVHYVKDGKIYFFDQFDFYFNRPDIVLERMGYSDERLIESYRKAFEKRKKKMGISKNDFTLNDLFNVPDLAITSNITVGAATNKMYNLSLTASDASFPITQLNVWVNGVPLYGKKGFQTGSSEKNLVKTVPIELSAGLNKIEVSVMNEIGVESLRESFELRYDPTTPVKPDLYLVSIGVSNFKDNNYNLSYAAKDAGDVAALYRSRTDMFNKVNIISLPDSLATRENIIKTKATLMKSRPDDLVILFIASHGLVDSNLDYFLATNDVDFDSPSDGGLLYEDFESLIDSIPSRKRLIFLDACHSGEIDKDEVKIAASQANENTAVKSRGFKTVTNKEGIGLENSFELMQTMFNDLRRGNGAVVLSSASGKEFAYESVEWKNGVFTFALLEGLKTKKADGDKNSKVTVSELKEYVIQRVSELTKGIQHPTSRKENLEFDFVVW